MKKILAAALCILAISGSALAQSVPKELQMTGTVTESTGSMVTIKNDNKPFDSVALHITDDTFVIQNGTGYYLDGFDVKKDDKAKAWYGPMLTRSLPPQGKADAIIAGKAADKPTFTYFNIGKVEPQNDGSVRVLNVNETQYVTISPQVYPDAAELKAGDKMLLWYEFTTMSLPGQATATKAVLLKHGLADINISTTAGVIATNGKELADVKLVSKNNTLYVPLRQVAEALGYTVTWNNDAQTAVVYNGPRSAVCTIGSYDYGQQRMRVKLLYAPELIDGVTMVPVEMLDYVMGYSVRIIASHV